MRLHRRSIPISLFMLGAVLSPSLAAGAASDASAHGMSSMGPHPLTAFLNEPPSAFLPGHYYFLKASFYLKKKDIPTAVSMLKIAASWGNKYAQYDLGVLYFNGMGNLPLDRPRGTAWFGIAAQNHGSLADQSLLEAWKILSDDERKQASAITDELMPEYADRITLRRAKSRFLADTNRISGSHLGHSTALTVTTVGSGDGIGTNGTSYLNEQRNGLDDMIHGLGGRVEIGGVQPIGLDGRPLPPKTESGGQ
jgi:hypothetical protein